MGYVWIFQPDNNPNTNLKNNTKMGHWTQNQASAMAIPVLRPEPYRIWVRWTEEKKHHYGSVNLEDLERFWMKEWSLISCQVFSNFISIIGENIELCLRRSTSEISKGNVLCYYRNLVPWDMGTSTVFLAVLWAAQSLPSKKSEMPFWRSMAGCIAICSLNAKPFVHFYSTTRTNGRAVTLRD